MAFYSFGRVKIISRRTKKSAVATASYHAAAKITDEETGITNDYSSKKNVGQTYILAPESSPEAWKDKSIPAKERLGLIWNTVQKENADKDARFARQFYLALQNDWSLEENLECLKLWAAENCVNKGRIFVCTLHDSNPVIEDSGNGKKVVRHGNLHADIMIPCQEFDQNGKKKSRTKREYLCRKEDGTEAYLDAEAFKNSVGFEKVYRYQTSDGEELRLTKSEAERRGDVTRINKQPVGRSVAFDDFDSRQTLRQWRKSWEEIINAKIVEKGLEDFEKVDCRSYADQGSWKLPTGHVGWEHGERAAKQIADNEEVAAYNSRMGALIDQTLDVVDDLEDQLDKLNSCTETMTEDLLKLHKKQYEENIKMLELASKSTVFGELRDTFEGLFYDLKTRFKKLFRDIEYTLALIKKDRNKEKQQIASDVSEAKKATSTLADLIKNAEVVKSKQAGSARQQPRKNDLEI